MDTWLAGRSRSCPRPRGGGLNQQRRSVAALAAAVCAAVCCTAASPGALDSAAPARSAGGREAGAPSSSGGAAWPRAHLPPFAPHDDNWAVLVSTSRYWFNYRHSANTLAMHAALVRAGVPQERIILMLADDHACDPRNVHPAAAAAAASGNGVASEGPARDAGGEVYLIDGDRGPASSMYVPGLQVDYAGPDVTVDALLRVLSGRHLPGTPASKRLGSGPASNVFLYMTGHGGDGFLKFQDKEELTSVDLAGALYEAWAGGRYREVVAVFDTCQAATLGEPAHSPHVVAIGSSVRAESSYAFGHDAEVGQSLSDGFTRWAYDHLLRHLLRESSGSGEGANTPRGGRAAKGQKAPTYAAERGPTADGANLEAALRRLDGGEQPHAAAGLDSSWRGKAGSAADVRAGGGADGGQGGGVGRNRFLGTVASMCAALSAALDDGSGGGGDSVGAPMPPDDHERTRAMCERMQSSRRRSPEPVVGALEAAIVGAATAAGDIVGDGPRVEPPLSLGGMLRELPAWRTASNTLVRADLAHPGRWWRLAPAALRRLAERGRLGRRPSTCGGQTGLSGGGPNGSVVVMIGDEAAQAELGCSDAGQGAGATTGGHHDNGSGAPEGPDRGGDAFRWAVLDALPLSDFLSGHARVRAAV
jgi:hypothetical protein